MPGKIAPRLRGIMAVAGGCAERGASAGSRRYACTTVSRPRKCPHVWLDPVGGRICDVGIRACTGAARRSVLRARVGEGENGSGNLVHSVQSRSYFGAEIDDRDMDAPCHIRGNELR